jgi:hypothetical protein
VFSSFCSSHTFLFRRLIDEGVGSANLLTKLTPTVLQFVACLVLMKMFWEVDGLV